MRIVLFLCLVGMMMHLVSAMCGGEDNGQSASGRRRIFVDVKNDPILQALGALQDGRLRESIEGAAEAYYSSRFTDAHKRIAEIMEKYPESAVGDVLYDFLLFMDGAALGFSGKCELALVALNRLQSRLESADDDSGTDHLVGVMSLKIDILVGCGDTIAALEEMDALIVRFDNGNPPSVRWRLENTMQRRAVLLERSGERELAIAAYKAFVENLQSVSELDDANRRKLDAALRKLKELQQKDGSENTPECGPKATP